MRSRRFAAVGVARRHRIETRHGPCAQHAALAAVLPVHVADATRVERHIVLVTPVCCQPQVSPARHLGRAVPSFGEDLQEHQHEPPCVRVSDKEQPRMPSGRAELPSDVGAADPRRRASRRRRRLLLLLLLRLLPVLRVAVVSQRLTRAPGFEGRPIEGARRIR